MKSNSLKEYRELVDRARYLQETDEKVVEHLRARGMTDRDIVLLYSLMVTAAGAVVGKPPAKAPPPPPPPRETETRFIAVTHWNRYHEWPSIRGLRHLIFNARYNGLEVALRRVGRRVLVNEKLFFEWVDKSPQTEIKVESKRRKKKR